MTDAPNVTDAPEGPDRQGVAARQIALSIVLQVHEDLAWASPVADRILRKSDLDAQDRAFATNLAFSTLRWEGTLDWVLTQTVTRGLEAVETTLVDLLRIATWELMYGHQPVHAVVDSHVEVARNVIGQRATGFVNGVLRNVARGIPSLPWPEDGTPEGLALRQGYPLWISSSAIQRFGHERAAAVLAAGNEQAPQVLRAVAPRDAVLAALADQGIAAEPGDLARDAIVLSDRVVPRDLDVIADGRAIVQDQASQVVVQVATEGLPAGATAIDLCAAPGGKATHLAQLGLDVTAVDRHAGRIRQTADLAAHLGLTIRTVHADGSSSGLPPGSADLVLLDAPCSGLGVVRRRPELRWRRSHDDVLSLGEVQRRLLRAAVSLVRPGGRVAYSVCTWTTYEADAAVEEVADEGLVTVNPSPSVGTATPFGTQIAPDVDNGDGMYISIMQRTESER